MSGSADQTIRVWARKSGQCLRVLVGHRNTVRAVATRGSTVFSAGNDGTVRVWRRPTEEEQERERRRAQEALAARGRLGGAAARVFGASAATTTLKREGGSGGRGGAEQGGGDSSPGPRRAGRAAAQAEEARAAATKLRDTYTSARLVHLLREHQHPVCCLDVGPRHMATGDEGGWVILWELEKLADPRTKGVSRQLQAHVRAPASRVVPDPRR